MAHATEDSNTMRESILLFAFVSFILTMVAVFVQIASVFLGHIEPAFMGPVLQGVSAAIAQFACFLYLPGRSVSSVLQRCFVALLVITSVFVVAGNRMPISYVKPRLVIVIDLAVVLLVSISGVFVQHVAVNIQKRTRVILATVVFIGGIIACFWLTGCYWVDDF